MAIGAVEWSRGGSGRTLRLRRRPTGGPSEGAAVTMAVDGALIGAGVGLLVLVGLVLVVLARHDLRS